MGQALAWYLERTCSNALALTTFVIWSTIGPTRYMHIRGRTVRCSSCGHDNPADSRFCDRCGAPLADAPSSASGAGPSDPTHDLGTTRLFEGTGLSFASGRYTVKRLLGEGGQKTVYLVRDEALERDCAFALIRTERMDPDSLSRIKREAQAMARLTHPNIVTIYDTGEEDSTPYIACEYVPSGDLGEELREADGPLPLDRAVAVAKDLCSALAFAHSQGIVHRDVKPSNVWLSRDGSAKLGDFGLAFAIDRSRLTATGTVMGTAAYMAPEQAQGQPVDVRADLYSLGCLLYELVTGRPPFRGQNIMAVISQHVHVPPAPPSDHNSDIPRSLERLILKLLAKVKEQRPSSAEDVLAELEGAATQPSAVPTAEAPPAVGYLQRLARAPFVGRKQEMDALKAALEQALTGKGSLYLLAGDPGIGKTRLVQELALYARLRGTKVLRGHCAEAEGSPSYLPFVEILDAIAGEHSTEMLRERLGEDAPLVAKLLPQIATRLRDLPAPPEFPPESERYMLFQAVSALLRGIAEESALILILEDLHWADKPSLLLLQHLARQLLDSHLLVVGLYRDVEVDPEHPLSHVLADLRRERLYEHISLSGLPVGDVRALITALSDQEASEAFAQALHQQTEGNPFFVEEILRDLVQRGVIYHSDAGWTSDIAFTEIRLPEGVKQAIGRRLARLGEDCHSLLQQAAVLGREFRHSLLASLAGKGEEKLLDLVEEALGALVLEETPGRETAYSFTHALTRQALLEELSRARRQRLHLRAADAIQATYASALEEYAAELAYHLSESGELADSEKTIHYLTLAGDRAISSAAFEEALRHFERALSLQLADDRQKRADLLFKRGWAHRSLGHWDETLVDWREALAVYEELGHAEAVGRVCAVMTIQLVWGARWIEALEISRRGLASLGEEVSADRCRLLATGGVTMSLGGYYDAAVAMHNQAVPMAEGLGDQRMLGEVLVRKTAHHWSYMQFPEAVDSGMRAAELLRSVGDLWNLADALWFTQYSLQMLGRIDEVARIGEELEPLATRLGYLFALLFAERTRGFRDFMLTGDIDKYEEFAKHDLEFGRSIGSPWLSNSYAFLGLVDFWRGRWEEALAHFQEAVKLDPPGAMCGAGWCFLFLGKAYAGDREGAFAMPEQQRDNLPRPSRANTIGAWTMLFSVVEGLAVLGARDEAATLHSLMVEAIGTGTLVRFADCRLLQTVAGIAAAAGAQWEKAEEHYQTALRQAHEVPVVIEQPEVRRWYARMLIERDAAGDRDKARQLLTEAIGSYRRLGMPKHVEMAEAQLEQTGGVA